MQKVTSSWFFLFTLNYDARSTTHQMYKKKLCLKLAIYKDHEAAVGFAIIKVRRRKTGMSHRKSCISCMR